MLALPERPGSFKDFTEVNGYDNPAAAQSDYGDRLEDFRFVTAQVLQVTPDQLHQMGEEAIKLRLESLQEQPPLAEQ